jgi:hypothetical protein
MWKVYKSHSSLPFARESISTSAAEQSLNQESFTLQHYTESNNKDSQCKRNNASNIQSRLTSSKEQLIQVQGEAEKEDTEATQCLKFGQQDGHISHLVLLVTAFASLPALPCCNQKIRPKNPSNHCLRLDCNFIILRH